MKQIDLFKVFMSPNAAPAVTDVLNSGYIGQGPKVEEFENDLKSYFNHDHLVTVNSGTSALHLALHLLKKPDTNIKHYNGSAMWDSEWPGLKPGDEVLCTALTCTASNWPVLANGLKIKWVDVDPKTLNMDLDDLARKITPKTKVIIAVHWGGYPIDLKRLFQIQDDAQHRFGFRPAVIEDCAHAFGSKYKGSYLGTTGNLAMYSFQAIKHMTSVDGGALLSPYSKLNNRAKLLRWYGIDREGNRKDFRCEADIPEWGFKFHMNDVCAAVGIENMKHVEDLISTHKNNASYYDHALRDVPGVQLLERRHGYDSAFWIYSMLVDNRPGFYEHMKSKGIVVSQVHERNDKHTCVSEFGSQLPSLDKTIGKVVSIPVGWWVSDEDREFIVDAIKEGW